MLLMVNYSMLFFCNHLLILELMTSRKQLLLYVQQQIRILSLVNFIVVLGK